MPPKILIVEDEPNIAELLIRNFERAGFETEAVYNGTDALLKAEKTRPNLIILDLMLPEVDGIEVCRMLKRNPETQRIPVVMLTAKGEEVDRIVGLENWALTITSLNLSAREKSSFGFKPYFGVPPAKKKHLRTQNSVSTA